MKRYITFIAAGCLMTASAVAQNVVDAARYGNSEISGTARYRSMAGAFGALGGDPSCMSDNPAGLAIYRGTSLFSFTPHVSYTRTESFGTETQAEKDKNFGLSNFAWVASFKTPLLDNMVNFNFGISVDRRMEAHSKYMVTLDGDQPMFRNGSFGEYLTNQGNNYLAGSFQPGSAFDWENQYTAAPFLSMLAWNSYAIDVDPNNDHRVIDPMGGATPYQRLYARERTRLSNYNLSAAANLNDMFYIGATLCITDFNSTIETEFDEDYDYNYEGSYIAYDNRFETKGAGIGLNVGLMWMPIDSWRIGAAVHTPVWNTMQEFYDGSMLTDDERVVDWETFSDEWQYDFSTPWEYQFSTAFILGNRGLLSFEYDLRDYTTMEYTHNRSYGLTDSYFHSANQAIGYSLKSQHTFKVGGEYRVTNQISARAGYAYSTSPYNESTLNATIVPTQHNITYYSTTKPNFQMLDDQHYITCGAGWRGKSWNFDLAYVFHNMNQKVAAYPGDFSTCTIVDVDFNQHNWDLTVGYRF